MSRLVIDPRYRGAGLAAKFLRRCCQMVPVTWIELIAVMAGVVPFAESAGFIAAGSCADKLSGRGTSAVRLSGRSRPTNEATMIKAALEGRVASRPRYYVFDNRENCKR